MARYNYANEKEDSWYRYKGVQPPQRTPNISEQELEDILKENFSNHSCKWRQRGNEIYCEVGNYTHGKKIGPNLFLQATKSGAPILVTLAELQSGLQGA